MGGVGLVGDTLAATGDIVRVAFHAPAGHSLKSFSSLLLAANGCHGPGGDKQAAPQYRPGVTRSGTPRELAQRRELAPRGGGG